MKKLILPFAIVCLAALTACSLLTSKPPSAVESKLFNVQTNFTPVIAYVTNTLPPVILTVTNPAPPPQVVIVTNPATLQVVTVTSTPPAQVVFVTNQAPPVIVTVTNLVPAYAFTPNQTSLDTAQAIGTVANGFLPGFGGLISTGLAGLLGLWATMRTKSKGNQIAANLTQAIETARSVIKSLPNGATIGSQFDAFLVAHQEDANLLNEVGAIVDNYVNPNEAQGAATKIIQLVTTPLNSPPPVSAAPSNS